MKIFASFATGVAFRPPSGRSIACNSARSDLRVTGSVVSASRLQQNGGKGGYVDIFDESGNFIKTLISGKPLNQPWGLAVAPSTFGPLSGTLLVGNNNNMGEINGFDLSTGAFVGTIKTSAGKPIKINQLWGIEFGGGTKSNGKTNQLFFTAGPKNNLAGTFGVIAFQ